MDDIQLIGMVVCTAMILSGIGGLIYGYFGKKYNEEVIEVSSQNPWWTKAQAALRQSQLERIKELSIQENFDQELVSMIWVELERVIQERRKGFAEAIPGNVQFYWNSSNTHFHRSVELVLNEFHEDDQKILLKSLNT